MKSYGKIQNIAYSQKIKLCYTKDLLCCIHYLVAKWMCIKHEVITLGALNLQICNNELFIVIVISMAFSSQHFTSKGKTSEEMVL